MKIDSLVKALSSSINYPSLLILLLSFGVFVNLALTQMRQVPFNEFDEAHRAENAKRMLEYNSFFVPLTGSVFDRIIEFSIPFRNSETSRLYLHLERPPLVYDLMILSVKLLGSTEYSYRLPSFILGVAVLISFLIYGFKLSKGSDYLALILGFLTLLCSADLWLSSQYAQLDTALSLFLFLSLINLILFINQKRPLYLIVAGVSLGLAILSKGQMAILLLWPILYLLITKRISLKQLGILSLTTLLTISPWVIYLTLQFGLVKLSTVFTKFAIDSASVLEIHHKAPTFWYLRWWWESFRPGWSLFLCLLFIDILRRKFSYQKGLLLLYILVNLVVLSIPENKLWWYALPLIPVVSLYIVLSLKDYLLSHPNRLINLALVLIVTSRPALYGASNGTALFYGLVSTILSIYILWGFQISLGRFSGRISRFVTNPQVLILAAIIFSVLSFGLRFPKIIPWHWNIKPVSTYYSQLAGKKCLWIYSMPPESVLFYSDAGEVFTLNSYSQKYPHCQNYIITPDRLPDKGLIFRQGNMKLYRWD